MKHTITIFEALQTDHKELMTLFREAKKAKSIHEKATLLSKIRNAFYLHSTAEEDAVYPKLEAKEQGGTFAMDGFNDHEKVRFRMAHLANVDPSEKAWLRVLAEIEELILEHVNFEETKIFALLRELFSKEDLTHMQNDFSMAKANRVNEAA